MSNYQNEYGTRKRWRKFACTACGEQFHIVIKNGDSGVWVRFMPPRFCPNCGRKVVGE